MKFVSAVFKAATDPILICDSLADIIREWDLTEDDSPWPITSDNVARLPTGVIIEIMNVLNGNIGGATFDFPSTIFTKDRNAD